MRKKKLADKYLEFLKSKALRVPNRGMKKTPELAPHLFPFQRSSVEHALRVGGTGLFLDTGLGKTECQLEWCQKTLEVSNGRSLILTPLAVAGQTKRRAERWGYEARVIREQSEAGPGINICNYDRLDKLDPSFYGSVSLDEASILKSFTGKTTRALVSTFKDQRWKLVATATPAPNDHMELGNYAEFLSIMQPNEMLSRWFINDASTASQEWRLKRHAERDFWDWMASWSRMAEKPSDLGDTENDERFVLPGLKIIRHRIGSVEIDYAHGLFGVQQVSASNMFALKRQTRDNRVKLAADIIGAIQCEQKNATRLDAIDTQPIQSIGNAGSEARSQTSPSESNTTTTIISTTNPSTTNPENDTQLIETNCGERDTPPTQSLGKSAKRNLAASQKPQNEMGACGLYSEFPPLNTTRCSLNNQENAPFVEQKRPGREIDISQSTIATPPRRSGVCFASGVTSASATSMIMPTDLERQQITSTHQNDWVVIWCDTNDEQDALERAFGREAVSIRGSMTSEKKEELHDEWLSGNKKILITKVSIFGFGMDWSHCNRMLFVGLNFSYEKFYQAVRRCLRFGQKREVIVDLIIAEGEESIGRIIDRKATDHDKMKTAMREAMKRANDKSSRTSVPYNPTFKGKLPSWLKSVA